MSTNFSSWNVDLLEIGALYPFPGTEMLWAWIGIGSWVLWHIIQLKGENATLDEEEKRFSDQSTLSDAMNTNYGDRD